MDDQKKLAIIATKGTLDWAYPPFILASTAAALGYEVTVFFTFYGLQLVRKDLSGLKVSPLGNPGMPMKMPFGPKWFRGINWNIPNIIQAGIPGYESVATTLMKKTIANNGVATIAELRDLCQEAEVKMIACQMTVELFRLRARRFHRRPGVCGRRDVLRIRRRVRHLSVHLSRSRAGPVPGRLSKMAGREPAIFLTGIRARPFSRGNSLVRPGRMLLFRNKMAARRPKRLARCRFLCMIGWTKTASHKLFITDVRWRIHTT